MTTLNGWHPGELLVQKRLGYDKIPSITSAWNYIQGELPEQHSKFHTSNLHFMPVVTLDQERRPWTSILTGTGGEIGWIKLKNYSTLALTAEVQPGDPFWETSDQFGTGGEMLLAGIGVEVSTRRRNKLAGKVLRLEKDEAHRQISFDVDVNEATGNCPKYIVVRSVRPYASPSPTILHERMHLAENERIEEDVISFIQSADTIWLGSSYSPGPSVDASRYPAHLGINHRGGRPGFVRVVPSDARTLVIPDYSGNRFMSSLGNIEYTPVASVTIANLETGDVLYLTGVAKNLYGKDAQSLMPLQDLVTTLHVTGYIFVKDSLPVRQVPLPGHPKGVEISPYSPPVKYLREEQQGLSLFTAAGDTPAALLTKIQFLDGTEDIAVFTFSASIPVAHKPGQYVILDWKSLLGKPQYRHMSGNNPNLVNDDLIRTWTISSFPASTDTTEFQLTIRLKPEGVVTSALFAMAYKIARNKKELLDDMSVLDIKPNLIGISGGFHLDTQPNARRPLLWGASGIGITPFLSMLRSIALQPNPVEPWDIVLLLSTREPATLLPLIDVISNKPDFLSKVTLNVHVFTASPATAPVAGIKSLGYHTGRLSSSWLVESRDQLDLKAREAYVCGPPEYERMVLDALTDVVGLGKDHVHRESFAF